VKVNLFANRLHRLARTVLAMGLLFAGTAHAQIITTVAGNGDSGYSVDGGLAISSSLLNPYDVAVDAQGNVYIADTYSFRIRKVTLDGVIHTIAGNGEFGFTGDGGPGEQASIGYISQIAVDPAGNVYMGDYSWNRIRKVSPEGIISTVVGGDQVGFSGDGGPASEAQTFGPLGVALDATGNLYFSDYYNQRIRKIDTNGIITTIAGNGNLFTSGPDNIQGTESAVWNPYGISADAQGNVYVAETGSNKVRKIDTDGIITTFAGSSNQADFSGDGGLAVDAVLGYPYDVAAGAQGEVYIADGGNARIREVSSNGIITTIAGNGSPDYSGDGGQALDAGMAPFGMGLSPNGGLYFVDNQRIRKFDVNFTTCAAQGFGGAQLSLCRQICETDHAPEALSALIDVYIRRFSSRPPCGI
jgi:trimeric autotransporter adhesin